MKKGWKFFLTLIFLATICNVLSQEYAKVNQLKSGEVQLHVDTQDQTCDGDLLLYAF